MGPTPRRIGLLGGTFDPIHYGHLRLAESLIGLFSFDELLFIPTYSPPHKQFEQVTTAYHRHTMTVLATLHSEHSRVSTIELFAPEKPYTVETVGTFRNIYGPDAHIFFLMGADSFGMLHQWYKFQTLIDLCHIIVMSRPGYDLGDAALHRERFGENRVVDFRNGFSLLTISTELTAPNPRIFLTDLVALDVSATEIRAAVSQGKSIAQYVPPMVERYIYAYQLYKEK
ncbi:MAG TPA: nicotinate-nucleotide adenylyltransferase [Acidobacteriota bacterium]|nr:nicotinate-nucleotide adenylyltransferase [Acidobacteriota bacterium]HNC42808.1 nicotinate-nucleotide adenylyltransferase [Acidobacteriota bacterium]HNH82409.1 nicotinate-nucleotide adenylyltransferase [Acidobacteriota bacterium]